MFPVWAVPGMVGQDNAISGLDIAGSYMGWDSVSVLLCQKLGTSPDSYSSTQVFEIENCARTSA